MISKDLILTTYDYKPILESTRKFGNTLFINPSMNQVVFLHMFGNHPQKLIMIESYEVVYQI